MYQKKRLLLKSSLYEIKSQYAGSSVGGLWVLLAPVILISFYSIIYLYVLKAKPSYVSQSVYILHLISGLLMYLGFVQSIQKTSSSISQNKFSIYNTFYPIEFVPLRSFFSAFLSAFLGFFFLFTYRLLMSGFNFKILGVLFILIFFMFFSMSISLVISLLTLGFRDIEYILQYIFMILIFITPIGFFPEQFSAHYRFLVYLNPLFYYINPLQKYIAFNSMPSWNDFFYAFAIALIMVFLCGKFFRIFKLTIFELI